MRVRSEWITIFTVTSLTICGLALPRHANAPVPDGRRKAVAAAGIDVLPTGTLKTVERSRPVRRQQP